VIAALASDSTASELGALAHDGLTDAPFLEQINSALGRAGSDKQRRSVILTLIKDALFHELQPLHLVPETRTLAENVAKALEDLATQD
jgi:hypothetical protein